MAYALKPDRPVASEVRRIADKQLELAVARLRASEVGSIDVSALHEARRHVKKTRALVRLVQPALGRDYRRCNRRLRDVTRLLSAVSDTEAVSESVVELAKRDDAEPCRSALLALRKALVRRRAKIARLARTSGDLRRAADLLEQQARLVPDWRLQERAYRAVGPGLARRVRGARRAFAAAIAAPTGDNYHRWRRRVKEHWLAVRLLQRRCGGALSEDQTRLESLDACLGDYHNTVLLQNLLYTDELLARQDTARVLRLLRCYQRELRREAIQRGDELYSDEAAAQFLERVERGWRTPEPPAAPAAPGGGPWSDAA